MKFFFLILLSLPVLLTSSVAYADDADTTATMSINTELPMSAAVTEHNRCQEDYSYEQKRCQEIYPSEDRVTEFSECLTEAQSQFNTCQGQDSPAVN